MKNWKIVSGILSVIIFVYFLINWFTTGIWKTITGQGYNYAASISYALCVLSGGIVSITTCRSKKLGGNVAIAILFTLSLIPMAIIGSRGWLAWSLACIVVAIVALSRRGENE